MAPTLKPLLLGVAAVLGVAVAILLGGAAYIGWRLMYPAAPHPIPAVAADSRR